VSKFRRGAAPTSAAWQLATRLETNRLEPRVRRMLNRLTRELTAAPVETIRGLLLARIARKELVAQQAEAYLLANTDKGVTEWVGTLWNSLRRDIETLSLLEQQDAGGGKITCKSCDSAFAELSDYTQHGCFAAPPTPSGRAALQVEARATPEPSVTPATSASVDTSNHGPVPIGPAEQGGAAE
jgi:hypothetical protein